MEKAAYQVPSYTPMCPYEQRTGNCLAKDMCRYKHALNVNAIEFDPTKKFPRESKPAPTPQITPPPISYPVYQQQQSDELECDNIEDFDSNELVEEFKDCECCHGYVYSCAGEICQDMGLCKCKMTADLEAA